MRDREATLAALVNPATERTLREVIRHGERALEVGCGPAQYRRSVRGHYVGIDITAAEYRPGLRRDPDAVADAHALPFGAATFDLVFFSNTFYLTDAARALREARRVLRRSGMLAIFDYSKTTLARLAASYARGGYSAVASVRSCDDWLRLLRSDGWTDCDVRLNTVSPLGALARVVLPPALYRVWIDRRERGIVVQGRAL